MNELNDAASSVGKALEADDAAAILATWLPAEVCDYLMFLA